MVIGPPPASIRAVGDDVINRGETELVFKTIMNQIAYSIGIFFIFICLVIFLWRIIVLVFFRGSSVINNFAVRPIILYTLFSCNEISAPPQEIIQNGIY